MKNWEKALEKFLKPWKKKKYVIAAVIAGTYVQGKADKYSDLDVQIICNNSINWGERGNQIVDGYLVEYFVNPVKQVKKYFSKEYSDEMELLIQ